MRAALGSTSQTIFATSGGALLQAAAYTGPAAPFVAAAGAIAEILAIAGVGSGCGPTCVLSSGIVDQLEPELRKNRETYFAGPRTKETQAYALAVFDSAFEWLKSPQACGAPDLNDAGRRCISDRAPGGKWDWYAIYRDPIAQDPAAAASSAPSSAELPTIAGLPAWQLTAAACLILAAIL